MPDRAAEPGERSPETSVRSQTQLPAPQGGCAARGTRTREPTKLGTREVRVPHSDRNAGQAGSRVRGSRDRPLARDDRYTPVTPAGASGYHDCHASGH
jgi:hypothetical protein